MLLAGWNGGASEDAKLYDPLEWATIALTEPDLATAFEKVNRRLVKGGLDRTSFLVDSPRGDACIPVRDRLFGVVVCAEFEEYLLEKSEHVTGAATTARLSCSERLAPTIFNHPETDLPVSSEIAGVMASFGFKGGFAASFFSRDKTTYSTFTSCSLTSTSEVSEIYDVLGCYIRNAFAFFNEARMLRDIAGQRRPILSRRESECLLWVAQGKTTQQIADQLMLNDRTVDEYIANAVRKLDASNRTHACARAIMLSLISP